jgi:hypothetical protein
LSGTLEAMGPRSRPSALTQRNVLLTTLYELVDFIKANYTPSELVKE